MTRKNPDGAGVKEMWKANEPVVNWERQYGFTQFAMTLNEPDEGESAERGGREVCRGRGGGKVGEEEVGRE